MKIQNQTTLTLVGLVFLIISAFSGPVVAQSLSISGKITDAETGEPLVFATIALDGEPFGTITNLAGEFDFHVPAKYRMANIIVSTLGYQNFSITVIRAALVDKLLVKLVPGRVILDEVIVTESLTAAELLKIAIFRIEDNYAMSPVEMEGFYRDTKMVDGEYVSLLEAAVRIYDKNYSAPRDYTKLRERVSLIEVRRTLEYDYSLEKYFSQYNMLEDLLLENIVKYRTFNHQDEFYAALKRKKVVGYNNEPIDLVYVEMPGYSLKMYIDDNYVIRKIVFGWGDGKTPIYSYQKSRKLENQVIRHDKQIEFQELNGKYYLKYIAASYRHKWYNQKTNEEVLTIVRNQALLVTKLNCTNPIWIKNSQKMKRYGLQFQHEAYNKEFWVNFNTIKEMPITKKLQLDLEKFLSLEEQFASFE